MEEGNEGTANSFDEVMDGLCAVPVPAKDCGDTGVSPVGQTSQRRERREVLDILLEQSMTSPLETRSPEAR